MRETFGGGGKSKVVARNNTANYMLVAAIP